MVRSLRLGSGSRSGRLHSRRAISLARRTGSHLLWTHGDSCALLLLHPSHHRLYRLQQHSTAAGRCPQMQSWRMLHTQTAGAASQTL